MSIELVMLSHHLILCCPLLLLPSIFPSIRVFSIESALRIRWPKYWNFSFSIHPSNEYSGFLGWTGWISLQSKGLSRVLPTPQFKSINSLVLSLLYSPTLTGKTIAVLIGHCLFQMNFSKCYIKLIGSGRVPSPSPSPPPRICDTRRKVQN